MDPRQRNNRPSITEFAAAAQALGVGSQQAPGLDPNKVLAMGQDPPIPETALMQLISQFGDNPQALNNLIPQLNLPVEDDNAAMQALEAMRKGGQPVPASRTPVTSRKHGPAEAILDENGKIIGFAPEGGGMDDLLKRYSPDKESVGGWNAFTYGLQDKLKGLFDWTKPVFPTEPSPYKPQP